MAVFVSGSGRTLENFFRRIDAGTLRAEIVLVVASKECRGAEIGRARGVETRVIPWREHSRESVEAMLRGAGGGKNGGRGAQWCALAGYLHLLPVPASFAGRVVNIHPALLPKFGGAGMYGHRVHQAVIDAGETRTGCTVHLCDDEYDRGAIVAQASCEVLPGDTPDSLAARVFALETALYPTALMKLFGESTPSEP